MRGLIEDLASPVPVVEQLPGLLQEDAFTQRFANGFDAVMAPILLTLDNLEAYFDPATAPPDFVGWLAEWVGVALDENWPPERQRALVAGAVDLFNWRGTVGGLSAHVALYAGSEPEIEDSGGSTWSETPNSPLPGEDQPRLVVRVRDAASHSLDLKRLDRIVSVSKPAHIPHRVEVVSS